MMNGMSTIGRPFTLAIDAPGTTRRDTVEAEERAATDASALCWFAPIVVALWTMIVCALPSLIGHHPLPGVHDEFSYLLAGETFAHGRLTNPAHPMWEHFETFHELMRPTYMSKFPPGQGMTLALGILLGDPIVGVWVTMGLACAACTWALRAWLSAGWSLAMGLTLPMLPPVHWWSQTYWGSGLALLGGALVIGACVKYLTTPRRSLAVIAAVGAALLWSSRPFEGALLCVVSGAVLLIVSLHRRHLRDLVLRFVVPGAIAMLPFVAMMGYYNWRVTGSATTLPYTLHTHEYMSSPLFFWQPVPPTPEYRHDVLRRFHTEAEAREYRAQVLDVPSFISGAVHKLADLLREFLYPIVLLVPVLLAFFSWRRTESRYAAIVLLLVPLLHILMTPWMRPQYMAPIVPCWIAILGVGARQLWTWRRWHIGPTLVVLLALITVGVCGDWMRWYNSEMVPNSVGFERSSFVATLPRNDAGHLVLVEMSADRSATREWVFNSPDIDHQPVIFARAMGGVRDRDLIDYYPGRMVWHVTLEKDRYVAGRIRPAP